MANEPRYEHERLAEKSALIASLKEELHAEERGMERTLLREAEGEQNLLGWRLHLAERRWRGAEAACRVQSGARHQLAQEVAVLRATVERDAATVQRVVGERDQARVKAYERRRVLGEQDARPRLDARTAVRLLYTLGYIGEKRRDKILARREADWERAVVAGEAREAPAARSPDIQTAIRTGNWCDVTRREPDARALRDARERCRQKFKAAPILEGNEMRLYVYVELCRELDAAIRDFLGDPT